VISRHLSLVILLVVIPSACGCTRGLLPRQLAAPSTVQTAELRRLPPLETEEKQAGSAAEASSRVVPLDDWGPADWHSMKHVTVRFE
jgi:hypothetical protein